MSLIETLGIEHLPEVERDTPIGEYEEIAEVIFKKNSTSLTLERSLLYVKGVKQSDYMPSLDSELVLVGFEGTVISKRWFINKIKIKEKGKIEIPINLIEKYLSLTEINRNYGNR